MADSLKNITVSKMTNVPQTQKAHPKQKKNSAGGYTFVVGDVERLQRFLLIGTEGGTYYSSEAKLSLENAKVVLRMAQNDHKTLVDTIVDTSLRGAAPKQNATLFALAIAVSQGTEEERRYALSNISKVVRTATHLFQFISYAEQFRGWGQGFKKAVGRWYTDKDVDDLAYQMVKYRNREGWTHRDVLRKAHPSTSEQSRKDLFRWAVSGDVGEGTPRLVEGFLKAQEPKANITDLISQYGLSWEMLPDSALNEVSTWDALLDKGVPMTALIRQLPRLTRIGVIPPMGGRTSDIVKQLADAERLKKARIHPLNLLQALRTYSSGRSIRGNSVWDPAPKIVDALDAAFYKSFDFVEPSGKRTLIALDVSGSMDWATPFGMTARDVSVALSMVTERVEPETHIVAFTHTSRYSNVVTPLDISSKRSLNENIRKTSALNFGGTDCALPFQYALKNQIGVDTFLTITDNETWEGYQHPYQALEEYRRSTGINSKFVAMGVTATESTLTNPEDPHSMSVVGYDPAVPKLISEFSKD